MPNHARWRIAADVCAPVRSRLMRLYPPRFPNFFAQSLTWAYGVDADFAYDSGMTDCTLYGLHTGPSTQAFLASVAGDRYRPQDGQLLYLPHSTADGIPASHAGQINSDHVETIVPITFGIALARYPMWQEKPKRVHAAA